MNSLLIGSTSGSIDHFVYKFDPRAYENRGSWSILNKKKMPAGMCVRSDHMSFLCDASTGTTNGDDDVITSIDEVKAMRVKALKQALTCHGVDISRCVEKRELVQLYMDEIASKHEIAESPATIASSSAKRLRVYGGNDEAVSGFIFSILL